MAHFTIHINRQPYQTDAKNLTGRQILALAGFNDDHDLFLLHGEGDRTGGTPIGLDQDVPITHGMHFRAIPSNRNFGAWCSRRS
jgi:hypothetical protein